MRELVRRISNPHAKWQPEEGVSASGALEVINDWGLVDLRVSLLEPTDLLGLPDLNGAVVRWVVPEQLPVVGQENRFPSNGVLFLDELTHAQPAMQSACFSLVLDRRCGPHRLLPGWSIVAASNCAEDNAQAFPLSPPLRNRFVHFRIRPSLDAFKEWALANQIDSRVIAFLNWNPTFLHQASENPEESFPTPRSWTTASGLLGTVAESQLGPAMAACVGPGTATMFTAFLELNASIDLAIDIAQLLRGKQRSPKLTMEAPDVAWALTGRITAAVQESPDLLGAAVGFYCTRAWKDVREIGRTGLADLKYVTAPAAFNGALVVHLEKCRELYGEMLT